MDTTKLQRAIEAARQSYSAADKAAFHREGTKVLRDVAKRLGCQVLDQASGLWLPIVTRDTFVVENGKKVIRNEQQFVEPGVTGDFVFITRDQAVARAKRDRVFVVQP